MGYQVRSLDELGDGYGFRKVRGRSASPPSASTVSSSRPSYEGPNHYHDTQDELYFVHRGTATFSFDGDEHEVRRGRPRPRRVDDASRDHETAGEDDLVLFVVGGKDGYVERDGQLVEPRRSRQAAGDAGMQR